jgi:hypothetical protein
LILYPRTSLEALIDNFKGIQAISKHLNIFRGNY